MVIPVVGDFAGPTAMRAVGDYLRRRGAVVTAFYTSNVEQYLFGGFGADRRFYRNVETLPIDSTSSFIRAVPVGAGPPLQIGGLPIPTNSSVQARDSAGVTIITASSTDSTGRTVTRVFTIDKPPAANLGAFTSGISSIGAVLDALAKGELSTYQQVVALTKTEGWQPALPVNGRPSQPFTP